jgi:hypothetical protein
MTQWLANAPPIVSYLIGIPTFMLGSILFLGAFFLKPTRTETSSILPWMRAQAGTIPPHYVAKVQSFRARLGAAAKKLRQRGRLNFVFLGFARVKGTRPNPMSRGKPQGD